jgi:mRNA-degrading endonuclease RelE of RelBE toxin-antitoxin system
MKIVYSKNFLKSSKSLPKQIKIKLANLLEIFQNNPFHPKIHTKHWLVG